MAQQSRAPRRMPSSRRSKATVAAVPPPPLPDPDVMDLTNTDDDSMDLDQGGHSATPSPLALPGKRSTRSPNSTDSPTVR